MQDGRDIADARRALAVHADAGHSAWIGAVQAFVVDRCGISFNSFHGRIQVRYDFIDAGNDDHLAWSKHHGADAVAGTIDVDQLTIHSDSVRAAEESIAGELFFTDGQ